MRNLFVTIISILCLAGIATQAQAAKTGKSGKAAQSIKERLVLMPLRVADEDKSLQGAMETALVQGLQQKYEVFSGEQVAQKAREIFLKESRSAARKECDETRCMQGIAEAFQAELIATANVTKRDGGYFLALSIQNIFDNLVVYSNSVPCKHCDSFQVVDKLKELSGASTTVAAAPASEEPQPKVNPNDPEGVTWAEAQKGNTVDDYKVYLDTYPKGKYLPFAKAKIKKLQDQVAETTQQDQSAWGNASSTATEASYQDYLNSYPKGQYTTLATERIANIAKLKKEASHPPADDTEFADKKTGLIWRRCTEGMVYSGGTCTGEASEFTYDEALQHAKSEASRTGIAWRVPEQDELAGIVDKKFNPTIDPTAFPATPKDFFNAGGYWSASLHFGKDGFGWVVFFRDGSVYEDGRNIPHYVRLVRAGQ